MFQLLKMIDGDLNVEKWKFCTSRREDIPQQGNGWDYGAFFRAYARCLVSKWKMTTQRSVPDFRKFMIQELESILENIQVTIKAPLTILSIVLFINCINQSRFKLVIHTYSCIYYQY